MAERQPEREKRSREQSQTSSRRKVLAMDSPAPAAASVLDSILHPSDFSEASRVAFAHALKAALIARATLPLVHVAPTAEAEESGDFPGVRETLERWGL